MGNVLEILENFCNFNNMAQKMNHFVAFRVSDVNVLLTVQKVQDEMMTKSVQVTRRNKVERVNGSIFKNTLSPLAKLHFTLHLTRLSNASDIAKAKLATERAWAKHKHDLTNNPVKIQIRGMGHFSETILFAKIDGEETTQRLTALANDLRHEFESLNLPGGKDEPFTLHMTIANIHKAKDVKALEINQFPRELWNFAEMQNFGKQEFKGIQLLGSDAPDGYFTSLMDCNIE